MNCIKKTIIMMMKLFNVTNSLINYRKLSKIENACTQEVFQFLGQYSFIYLFIILQLLNLDCQSTCQFKNFPLELTKKQIMEFTSTSQRLSKLSTLRQISPKIAFGNGIFSNDQNQLPRIKAIPANQQTAQNNLMKAYQEGISNFLSSVSLNKNETENKFLVNDESLSEQVGSETFIDINQHSKSMISTLANSEQQSTSNLSINESLENEDIILETHQKYTKLNFLDQISANLDILGDQAQVAQGQLSIEDFQILSFCGQGAFGVVYIVKHKLTGFIYALKKIIKENITSEIDKQFLIREIKIHLKLNHSNIIKFYTTFSSSEAVYLLMELCPSGNLYEKLREEGSFSESFVKSIIRQVCKAIDYLHSLDIIHGDIKAENIVLQGNVAKLCDFGWATEGEYSHKHLFGTLIYMSPEIIKKKSYDNKVDVWSMGVLTYELIYGRIPFEVRCQEDLSLIVCEDVHFPRQKEVSEECKDFISECLHKDSFQRWDTQRLLEHPFLKRE